MADDSKAVIDETTEAMDKSLRSLRIELPESMRWSLDRTPCYPEFGREVARSALARALEALEGTLAASAEGPPRPRSAASMIVLPSTLNEKPSSSRVTSMLRPCESTID